jgi:hypothetical protein
MADLDADSGLVEPRLVKVRAGDRGAGWAVGTMGVLTAQHVVAPFLEGRVTYCLAVPEPRPGGTEFDCTVAWQDKGRGLALLCVDEAKVAAWAEVIGAGPGPALAEPGTASLQVEAVGYPDATVEEDFPHPEQVSGVLLPVGGAVSGLMPFDVDNSVREDSSLWRGMSGAAVRERVNGRLVGVVVEVDHDRQQRRLYVRALPDPAVDSDFATALDAVGARPVLEAPNARAVRRLLKVCDEAGRPYPVGRVTQLTAFGVRESRSDVETHGDPYYPYVRRGLDTLLDSALDRRAEGTDTRMLLLIGDAMSGKSRTGAQALSNHPVLSTRELFVPDTGADLREVADLTPAAGAVLWLDDLTNFKSGLEPLLRDRQTHPGLVVVATLRSELFSNFLDKPELGPTWAVVKDEAIVERFVVPGDWSAQDQEALAGVEATIRDKVAEGLSLGEVLGAGPELRELLAWAKPFERKAVAFTIIDWARVGLTGGIAETTAEKLWPSYLSKRNALIMNNKDPDERHEDFLKALKWLREPLPQTATMLVRRVEGRLYPEDYLVAHPIAEQRVIPHDLWVAALNHAQTAGNPEAVFDLAYNAAISGVHDVAQAAWGRLAADKNPYPEAALNLGVLRHQQGDPVGACAAYQIAIDGSHGPTGAAAALNLSRLLQEQGDPKGAGAAFDLAVRYGWLAWRN